MSDAKRTAESLRAETAYQDWSKVPPSDRPLVMHRAAHARVLFELLRDHQVSRSWFALQLGLDEKQVRKMLKAEIAIPSTVVACMTTEMRADYLTRLGALEGPSLSERIARLDMAGALEAQRQLTERLIKLAGGR